VGDGAAGVGLVAPFCIELGAGEELVVLLGKDAVELVAWEKPIAGELRHIATVLKLLEYRIFSRFPALSRIVKQLPG